MRIPNQGTGGFQDEKELYDFIVGNGKASAALGVSGGGALRKNLAQVSLANDTSTQSVFGSGKGQFTVEAGKSYVFEGVIVLNNGSTSHTTLFGLVKATAVLANVRIGAINTAAADDTPAAATMVNLESETPAAINAASTAVETIIRVFGSFDCTTGGTVQPAVAFGAAPGGTNTVEVGSWFKLSAVGYTTSEKFGAVT